MDGNKKKNYIIGFVFFWILYCMIINTYGFCNYWIEEFEDGWHVMYADKEDGVSYEDYIDGPLKKDEAIREINEIKLEAKKFRRTYGTVFNLIPETKKDQDIYSISSGLIMFLLTMIFMRGPVILLFIWYFSITKE
jgi:hypothetical protein|tara:strand:+ start:1425 stop:1832 length:408 start_codon:yes stop_codon:yes gene_type:complete